MKRILAVILAVLMLTVVFVSCENSEQKKTETPAEPETAYTLLKNATEKTAQLSSFELQYDGSTDQTITIMGTTETTQTPIKGSTKVSGIGTDNEVSVTVSESETLGQKITTTVYTDKNYAYIETMGMKYKLPVASEEAKQFISQGNSSFVSYAPAEEIVKNSEITTEADGSKSVTFTMTKDQFVAAYSAYSDEFSEALSQLGEGFTMDFSDISITMTVNKDGYVAKSVVTFKMTYSMSVMGFDMTGEGTVSMNCAYVDPGKEVTVTLPADLDSYVEDDASL